MSTSTTPGTGDASRRMAPKTAQRFWLIVAGAPDTVTVRVDADLDVSAAVRLGAMLTDLIVGQGNLAVALDLTGLCRLDLEAVEVIGAASAAASARGGTLTLRGTPETFVLALTAGRPGMLIGRGSAGHRTRDLTPPEPSSRSRHPAGSAVCRVGRGNIV